MQAVVVVEQEMSPNNLLNESFTMSGKMPKIGHGEQLEGICTATAVELGCRDALQMMRLQGLRG